MIYNSIHETVIEDVFETLRDGISMIDGISSPRTTSIRTSNSLARATSGLTLVFPVICTNTINIENASMIAKAIERKNVAMLQIAFSAYNITNSTDAVEHLSKFHTNLNTSKMDLDKFMDIMDALGESYFDKSMIDMVNEDCKRNINFVLDDSINESSLLEFKQVTDTMGRIKIVREAMDPRDIASPIIKDPNTGIPRHVTMDELERIAGGEKIPGIDVDKDDAFNWIQQNDKRASAAATSANSNNRNALTQSQIAQQASNNKAKLDQDDQHHNDTFNFNKKKEKQRKKEAKQTYDQKEKHHYDQMGYNYARSAQQASDQIRQAYSQQLISSEVKKANEMQPSLLMVNFYVNDADKRLNIAQQAVAGVKSKLYAVDSSDIITKIVTKHADSNVLLKLVKVATRELSFVKDFLLGIDQARLDALSRSRRGSGNSLFRALERRAIKGKIRKSLRLENSAKAISTLVISLEESEDLKKYNDIDVMQPRNIVPIMEKLNLLYFVVVDTVGESVSIITDGENKYETYSFTSLEREAGDGAYKKVVNLMTKLA